MVLFSFERTAVFFISISGKKHEKIFFMAHETNLIQSAENNLTIILVQEWRFFVKSKQSYKFFQFFRKSGVVN